MSRSVTIDWLLIVAATAWLGLLLVSQPDLTETPEAFYVTAGFIAVNAAVSFGVLTCQRRVLIGLNLTQIVLFGFLCCQLHRAFGDGHYTFDREPAFYDWMEFTAAHVLRAADLLDSLDEYGVNLQAITHRSVAAGIILVCLHLAVDVFLIGLVLRWLNRFWKPASDTELARERRGCALTLLGLALF